MGDLGYTVNLADADPVHARAGSPRVRPRAGHRAEERRAPGAASRGGRRGSGAAGDPAMMRATACGDGALALARCSPSAPVTRPRRRRGRRQARRRTPAPRRQATFRARRPRSRLAGEYRLRLVPTAGPRSGAGGGCATSDSQPLADSLQVPPPMLGVHGHDDALSAGRLDRSRSRARRWRDTGDNASTDPTAPGVLVIERHPGAADAPTRSCSGSAPLANRRGVARFDGGYFALTVRRIDADGFAGTWSSGTARPSRRRLLLRRAHRPLTRRDPAVPNAERDPRRLPRVPFV